jgi:hypothetical protein
MIFRAIFWIAVVAILMPREPDLGLGRPGVTSSLPGSIFSKLTSLIEPGSTDCKDREMACIAASGAASQLQNTAFQSLAQVKAEIEEARRERAAERIASR